VVVLAGVDVVVVDGFTVEVLAGQVVVDVDGLTVVVVVDDMQVCGFSPVAKKVFV